MRRRRLPIGLIAKFATVVVVIAFGIWLGTFALENDVVRNAVATYGYAGVFVIAVISGFNLVVPIPAVAFMPVLLAGGLDLWVSVAVIALGMTIADMVAFFAGRTGRHVMKDQDTKALRGMERIRDRNPAAPLVVMFLYASAAPLPNELLAIPLGLMGYRSRHVFPSLLIGNFFFNSISALGITAIAGV